MSGDPINPAAAALLAALSVPSIVTAGVPATQIHYGTPPTEGRAYPYILLDCLDAPEMDMVFTGPTWTEQVWAIRVVTEADADLAGDIAGAVNLILEGADLNIAGYRSMCCFRRRAIPVRPVLGTDNVNRFHGGGEYTIGVGEPA